MLYLGFFFFNDTATTEIYTLSLHDALPILQALGLDLGNRGIDGVFREGTELAVKAFQQALGLLVDGLVGPITWREIVERSEEHTSELQSRQYLVCRLLLEKKTQIEHTASLV